MDKIEKIPIPEDVKRVLDNVSHILIGLNYRRTAGDYKRAVEKLISLLEAEDPDKVLEGEVILNGHGLLVDATKWDNGYKLKVIIKEH